MGKKIIMKHTVEYMIQQASLGVEYFLWKLGTLNQEIESEKETHYVYKSEKPPVQLKLEL